MTQTEQTGLGSFLNASNADQDADEICEPCPNECVVEVGAFHVVAGRYHLFIRYTLADGTQRFYRGGPVKDNVHTGAAGSIEFNAENSEPSGDFRTGNTARTGWGQGAFFGSIITHWGNWPESVEEERFNQEIGSFENPEEAIVEVARGPQHCGYHESFVALLSEIGALNIPYNANVGAQNSNSVVFTLLRHTRLRRHKPDVRAPGWGLNLLQRNPQANGEANQ